MPLGSATEMPATGAA
jgi:HlyD family secretion protein